MDMSGQNPFEHPHSMPDGEAVLWLGELAIIRVTGEETDGRYSIVELWAAKEGEVPRHIHHNEDEAFYILEGEMTIHVGEKAYKGTPGSFIFAPRGVPHVYRVDTPGHARVLMICSPAGFEDFVRATSVPAKSLVPPPPTEIDMDFDDLTTVAEQYGMEFVESPEAV